MSGIGAKFAGWKLGKALLAAGRNSVEIWENSGKIFPRSGNQSWRAAGQIGLKYAEYLTSAQGCWTSYVGSSPSQKRELSKQQLSKIK